MGRARALMGGTPRTAPGGTVCAFSVLKLERPQADLILGVGNPFKHKVLLCRHECNLLKYAPIRSSTRLRSSAVYSDVVLRHTQNIV